MHKIIENEKNRPNISYNQKLNLDKSTSGSKAQPPQKMNSFTYSKMKQNIKKNTQISFEVNLSSNYISNNNQSETVLNKILSANQNKSRNPQTFLAKNNSDNYPFCKSLSMTNQSALSKERQLISITKDEKNSKTNEFFNKNCSGISENTLKKIQNYENNVNMQKPVGGKIRLN